MNEIIPDGNSDFLAGQNSSLTPDKVAPNGYWAGINVTTKNGSLGPRWGKAEQKLTFPDGGVTGTDGRLRSWELIFHSGKFQAMIPWEVGPDFYFIIVINGVIFAVNTYSLTVQILTYTGPQLNPHANRINWSDAGRFLVLFDYPAYPVIIEQLTARRADPAKMEVPISRLGAFNNTRLFIVNGGNEFTGGDPTGSKATPEAPITFEEILTPASNYYGQIFQVDAGGKDVTGMCFLQAVDSSTGIGSLLISSKYFVNWYAVNSPRVNWESMQFEGNFIFNAGFAGTRSQVNVNSDLWFVSGDGQVRSAAMSRDEQKRFTKIPVSREVEYWLKYWDISLTKFAVITYFQNKIIVSANPFRTEAIDNNGNRVIDYAHAGEVVLEFDNLSAFAQASAPSWAGLWLGTKPMEYGVSDKRLFVMSKDNELVNKLYMYTQDNTYDYKMGEKKQIHSRVYTRSYSFQAPYVDKELNSLDMSLIGVAGDLMLDVHYKPEHGKRFLKWKDFRHKVVSCVKDPTKAFANGFAKQSFRALNLGSPKSGIICDKATNDLYNTFRKVQLRLDITAESWELSTLAIRARVAAQPYNDISCSDEVKTTYEEADSNNDWNLDSEIQCPTIQ